MRPPIGEPGHDLGTGARAAGAIVWSAFLAGALGTMVCFAFLDPDAVAQGDVPSWWSSRLHVYALGFFFFWMIGLVAAALCWNLTRTPPRNE